MQTARRNFLHLKHFPFLAFSFFFYCELAVVHMKQKESSIVLCATLCSIMVKMEFKQYLSGKAALKFDI